MASARCRRATSRAARGQRLGSSRRPRLRTVGLQTFRQSPVLDELVAAGELPPVAERLPDDPVVVEPFGEIGRYGGTARLFFAGESLINVPEGVLRPGPQMRLNLPNFAQKAEYLNGASSLTTDCRRPTWCSGSRWKCCS